MAGAAARAKKARARRPWSKEDIRLLKSAARKEPAAKIARALSEPKGQKAKSERISLNMTKRSEYPRRRAEIEGAAAGSDQRPCAFGGRSTPKARYSVRSASAHAHGAEPATSSEQMYLSPRLLVRSSRSLPGGSSGAASCRARPRILAQTGTGLDR